MAVHHVEAPEQVVTPGEELWVKIIDIDLDRRRISLSIKQAAEGGVVAAEYQDHFGEHAYDEQGNYIGPVYEEAAEAADAAEPAAEAGGAVEAAETVEAAPAAAPADLPDSPAAEPSATGEAEGS
jgi:small subunit ribosomal protein S1